MFLISIIKTNTEEEISIVPTAVTKVRLSTENIKKFMGDMRFSKQKIWENYRSFMGFTVKNMGEIVVNLS